MSRAAELAAILGGHVTGAARRGDDDAAPEVIVRELDRDRLNAARKAKLLGKATETAGRRRTFSGKPPVVLFVLDPPAQLGAMLVLTTGPALYASSMVKAVRLMRPYGPEGERRGWPEHGFVLAEGALWSAAACVACGGSGRDRERPCDQCKGFGNERTTVIQTPTEEAFYGAIGMRAVPVERRGGRA